MPADYVEAVLLPQHEAALQALIDDRTSGLMVASFGSSNFYNWTQAHKKDIKNSDAYNVIYQAMGQSGLYGTYANLNDIIAHQYDLTQTFNKLSDATQQQWLGYILQWYNLGTSRSDMVSKMALFIQTGGASEQVGEAASQATAGQLADIATQYQAAQASITQQVSDATAAVNQQYQTITNQIASLTAQAQAINDGATVTQMGQIKAQAQIAYQADLTNITNAQNQAIAALNGWQAQAQAGLASALTNAIGGLTISLNLPNPAANLNTVAVPGVTPAASISPTPSVSPSGTTTTVAPSEAGPMSDYIAPDGTEYSYDASTGQYILVNQTVPASVPNVPSANPAILPSAPAAAPAAPVAVAAQADPITELLGWLASLFATQPGAGTPAVPAAITPASPAPTASVSPDVLSGSGWGNSPFGNSTIQSINRLGVMPRSSAGLCFGQWATIVGSVIQAASQIGTAAISASLAPSAKAAAAPAAAPVIIQQPAAAAPATNYTPWLIGGGVGLAALVLVLVVTQRRRD